MSIKLRELQEPELTTASELCLRSKAIWGYDEVFLKQCIPALTLTAADLQDGFVVAAEKAGEIAGIAELLMEGTDLYLDKLFVDPGHMGTAIGKALFEWAVREAKAMGVSELLINADPGAATFYKRMGCVSDGKLASTAIPGRFLPRFRYVL